MVDLKKHSEKLWRTMQSDGTVFDDNSIDGIQPNTPASKEYLGIFYDLLDYVNKEDIETKIKEGRYL